MKTLLPLIAVLALFACSQQSETTSLRQSLSSFATPAQTFTINPNADTVITTSSGIMIGIPAHSLITTDSSTVDQPIIVEITEVLKKSEMIFNGISTVYNNQLLESVGMFHIRAISNGKELVVKKGSTLYTRTENIKADSLTQLFYGNDNNGITEWETSADELTPIFDTEAGHGTPRRGYESQLSSDTIRAFTAQFDRLNYWINFDKIVQTRDTKSI